MSYTAEEVSSKIGVSAIKIDNRTLDRVNEISSKYPKKIFNLDMLDAKWKTFTFRNKIKNMNNITPNHLINFFKQIEDQCKQQQISMIIDDEEEKPLLKSKKEEVGEKRSLEQTTATEENELKKVKVNEDVKEMNQYQGNLIKEEEVVEKIKEEKILFDANFKNKLKESMQSKDILSEEVKVLKELKYKVNVLTDGSKDEVIIKNDSTTTKGFKIFRESTTSLSKFLNTQLSLKENLYEKYEVSDPTIQSQSAIYCVGRIVNDSVTEIEPTFEKTNLALETSRKVGIGRRIKIDIGNLKEGELFLGQVVLCKGRNVTGEEFIIDEIVKTESDDKADEEMESEDSEASGFKICSINGPLCGDSTLDHTVFSQFVDKLNSTIKPDYLIINGPLLDITNKCITSGMIPPIITKSSDGSEVIENVETLDDIFQKLTLPLLSKISSTIKVILVPHATDTISTYSSYPQPSYNPKLFANFENVVLLPNPGFLCINGLNLVINNIDIFKNLKTIDIQNTKQSKFKLITELMIANRDVYPLYPTIPSLSESLSSEKRFKDMFTNLIPGQEKLIGVNKQRMNKNVNVQIPTVIPEGDVHLVLHNSGFVPHLEEMKNGGCTMNTNGFYNGDKMGCYGEITVEKKNVVVKVIKL